MNFASKQTKPSSRHFRWRCFRTLEICVFKTNWVSTSKCSGHWRLSFNRKTEVYAVWCFLLLCQNIYTYSCSFTKSHAILSYFSGNLHTIPIQRPELPSARCVEKSVGQVVRWSAPLPDRTHGRCCWMFCKYQIFFFLFVSLHLADHTTY